jgi:diguanylate cyclase (GGDEF)-like protein/PAS domain S-box-containing protein
MSKQRSFVSPQGDARGNSDEAGIGRLASANRRLQREIADRLDATEHWNPELLFRAMIDQVPDYLFIKDLACRFVIANRAVASDLGLTPDDLIGKTDLELHPHETATRFFADDLSVMRSGESLNDIDEFIVDPDGNKKWLLTTKVPLRDDRNEIVGIVGIARDVPARKQAEAEANFLAHHDALTRLPNRSFFMGRLRQAVSEAGRRGNPLGVAFYDLDDLKPINDSFGHSAGDDLLKTVATRMTGCLTPADMAARIGGDEFVVMLSENSGLSSIRSLAEKVCSSIAEPMSIAGHTLQVSCSMGLATFPDEGVDAETLLKSADAAMYRAKTAGRGGRLSGRAR